MGIGKRVKEARERLGLTQSELGKLVGVTGSSITNYENETSHPKESILYKLLDVLGVDANYLFQDCFIIKPQTTYIIESKDEITIISGYRKLNSIGKAKLNEQLNDMLSLEKYVSANSDSEIAQEITPINIYEPLTSDAEIDAEVEDYRRQLLEEREAAEKSKALRDAKEA